MDNSLVLHSMINSKSGTKSLNPCCNGQLSSTRPNKTTLIINKLKSRAKQMFIFINRKLTIS